MLRGVLVSPDESLPFECQHHLVNLRWADTKILLHVGFRPWIAVDTVILVKGFLIG
jgi:hypothetical protein